ncbi:hypothetical protein [Halorubellus salinus]|uniref:hypothetical protein n=1 Tax=Halorubellus salinus TaxID=755309 RepID=UPI001D073C03|nr:hypothetical protein [Halorubellus salinus]
MSDQRERRLKRRRAVEQARRNRDDARAKLLVQHRKLAASRAQNRRRTADADEDCEDGPHSTVPSTDTEDEAATGPRHSTVPRRVRGGEDDPPTRLYGQRLRRAAKRAAEDEDAEGTR